MPLLKKKKKKGPWSQRTTDKRDKAGIQDRHANRQARGGKWICTGVSREPVGELMVTASTVKGWAQYSEKAHTIMFSTTSAYAP